MVLIFCEIEKVVVRIVLEVVLIWEVLLKVLILRMNSCKLLLISRLVVIFFMIKLVIKLVNIGEFVDEMIVNLL